VSIISSESFCYSWGFQQESSGKNMTYSTNLLLLQPKSGIRNYNVMGASTIAINSQL
jgi:hypothetical protein